MVHCTTADYNILAKSGTTADYNILAKRHFLFTGTVTITKTFLSSIKTDKNPIITWTAMHHYVTARLVLSID